MTGQTRDYGTDARDGRAFALLNQLSFGEDKAASGGKVRRIIRGIASTITPDRYGDVVEPLGAKFALPIPALWQHDSTAPVGTVTEATPGVMEIPVVMEIQAPDTESETLNERLREAWASVTTGLVRGLSIGFRPLGPWQDMYQPDTGTFHFREWEWLELSLVTIPANAEATISAVKAYALEQARGASVPEPVPVLRLGTDHLRRARLAVSGVPFLNPKGKTK